jgi:hypothetical protein
VDIVKFCVLRVKINNDPRPYITCAPKINEAIPETLIACLVDVARAAPRRRDAEQRQTSKRTAEPDSPAAFNQERSESVEKRSCNGDCLTDLRSVCALTSLTWDNGMILRARRVDDTRAALVSREPRETSENRESARGWIESQMWDHGA